MNYKRIQNRPVRNIVDRSRAILASQLINECLHTHSELNEDDINFALQFDFSDLSDEQLATIMVHLCTITDIGRFSLSFNFDVDRAIIDRNEDRWKELLTANYKEAFPEFYDQIENFTKLEQSSIQKAHTREYNAAFQTIKNATEMKPPYKQYLIKACPISEISECVKGDISSSHDRKVMKGCQQKVTLYQSCLKGVCIAENKSEINFISPDDDSDVVMVPVENKVQCFSLIDLIRTIIVNKNAFSPAVSNMIQRRFPKEIKLYTHFLERLNHPPT